MAGERNILLRLRRRWLVLRVLEIFLFAAGPAILVHYIMKSWPLTFIVFSGLTTMLLLIYRPWQLSLKNVCSYIDHQLKAVEFSTSLLLPQKTELSGLAKIQRHKVGQTLKEQAHKIKLTNNLAQAGIMALLLFLLGFSVSNLGLFDSKPISPSLRNGQENISLLPMDSIAGKILPPRLLDQSVTIIYPKYTGRTQQTNNEMNIKALEGSRLHWKIEFSEVMDSVFIEVNGASWLMNLKSKSYFKSMILRNSGIYNFRFVDSSGGVYLSELYSIEMIKDQRPILEVKGLKQFTSFEYGELKQLNFETAISDDFGVAEAAIVATVSKGSGESVKFREEKLPFDNRLEVGSLTVKLAKKLDLDRLQMDPGDELYFYIEARDLRQPEANFARSETYFAIIKDTLSNAFAVEGTLGADLMPDYFRSQRQLIIDTEKLIAIRSEIPKKEFNSTSNELGFDQKSLRLKYGEFMGDETEVGGPLVENDDPQNEEDAADPLEAFTHDHDGDNEHNLVEERTSGVADEEKKEDPLNSYLHNHEDSEASTLFTQSLRSKLKQAMTEMWDAELYLRLFQPQKSLPYQYRALGLIQEIKNSARIYVHRIGFDPPPIKEEVRLTGKIDEVKTFQKQEDAGTADNFLNIKLAAYRIEQIGSTEVISKSDRDLFERAGNELSLLAIEHPGKYLKSLQNLKWLSEGKAPTSSILEEVQKGLFQAIPESGPKPVKYSNHIGEINELLLLELGTYD